MRKIDLITNISENTHILKSDVQQVVEQLLIEISNSLEKGEGVYIRGFGSFIVKKRAAKLGRNVKAGTTVNVPECIVPKFIPSDKFKNKLL